MIILYYIIILTIFWRQFTNYYSHSYCLGLLLSGYTRQQPDQGQTPKRLLQVEVAPESLKDIMIIRLH